MRYYTLLLIMACLGLTEAQAQCNLSCQSNVINVAISETGLSEITSDMFVTGMTGPCAGNFTIQLFNQFGQDLGNTADCSMLGLTLTARITHDDSGNFCESSLLISDNIAPTVTCTDVTVNCSASTDPADVGGITVTDNCDPAPALNFTESVVNQLCLGLPDNRIITRTYTATDVNGNTSSSCQQQIFVQSADLADVVFPPDYDNNAQAALDCSASYPTSAQTGLPTLFGNPVEEVCKINIDFSDQIFNICEGSYKILRTWTALDCCTGATLTDIQTIVVMDNTGPTIDCPAASTVSTDPNECQADLSLPTLTVSDDCSSNTDVRIFSNFGIFTSNGAVVNDVPEGTHDFNYRFTDDCGNESFCLVTITVEDSEAPTMICEQFIDVSIGTSGIGFVDAIDLDEGSLDNCCPLLTFEVKRQGEADTEYGAQEAFTCQDLGIQTLVLRGTDCNGFSNTCMIQVEVEDNTNPLIACPPALTVNCVDYPLAQTSTGSPTVFDNCTGNTIDFTDVENLNACDVGTVVRTFTVTDAQGLSASCTQTITYEDSTPLTVTFPPDISIDACGGNTDVSVTGEPSTNADCELIGYNIQNDTATLQNGCGIKILRTHQIMDLCTGTMFSDVQEIAVTDNEAPVFDQAPGALDVSFACDETVVLPPAPTASDACSGVTVSLISDMTTPGACAQNEDRELIYQALDACGNSALYSVNITVSDTDEPEFTTCPVSITTFATPGCERLVNFLDVAAATDNCSGTNLSYTNDSPHAFANGPDITGNYPIGNTPITITATDECGNTADCLLNITVNDAGVPDIDCIGGVTEINLTTDTFIVIPPAFFDAGTTDCSTFTLELSQDTFSCADLASPPFEVTLTATDAFNNSNSCSSTVFVSDPNNECENERPAFFAGTIATRAGEPMTEVAVALEGEWSTTLSYPSETGVYYFESEADEICEIHPIANETPVSSVTTWDLIRIKRHILNIEPLASPYAVIAADVNNSGSVTMADILEIQMVILGMQTEYINSPAWRFIPVDYDFPNPENPFDGGLPPNFLSTNPAWEEIDLDFIAIKIGDVD